jgi:hypothetical protein
MSMNAAQNVLMSSTVAALAGAVKTSHKLDGEIYGSSLMVAVIAAYRMGREWAKGETAEEKVNKFPNAYAEFENHYIAAGNAVYRDSDELQEFRNIKSAIRKKESVGGPLVRAYKAAAKAAGLTKKEHAIAEVSRFAKKIFEDVRVNHPGLVRDMAASEDTAVILKMWQDHCATTYGATVYALKAYFTAEKADGEKADPIKAAEKKLADLTDVAELTAIIARLQARADELTGAVTLALKPAAQPAAQPAANDASEDAKKAA